MSPCKPAFFVEKKQKNHSLFYWQPSASLKRAGFKTARLGKDEVAAIKKAEALNQQVDKWRGGLPVRAVNRHGTIPWIIETFKQSPAWTQLRPKTILSYEDQFKNILKWSKERGDPAMRTITRRDAEQLWASLHERIPRTALAVITRCCQLWNYALDLEEDVVERNPFMRLGLPQRPPRSQVWQPSQITAVIQTAISMGHLSIALAVIIAINTAQRPSDIRALWWSQYDGRHIRLTQIKTGKSLTIPATKQLKQALDEAQRVRKMGKVVPLDQDGPIIICEKTGGVWANAASFSVSFRNVCEKAGIPSDLQFRDLRRTATTHLAEAGCTPHQIASIGGWSIDTVAKMMETYAPVNLTMAEAAIERLEAYRGRPLEG